MKLTKKVYSTIKYLFIVTIIINIFMFNSNVHALTSTDSVNLADIVNDNSFEYYKTVDTILITQKDVKYLDEVDFSKFENLTNIIVKDCYKLDGSKIIPNKKVNLSINNSVLDLSKFDISKFENIYTSIVYNTSKKTISDDNLKAGIVNSEYNIDKKHDEKLNKIAEKIYLKSKNKADIIKNVTLYVVNNLEYDYDGTYASLPIAESILKYKMGVCAHYAYLESQLLNKLGIFSLDISGYTDSNDRSNSTHAWVIVYINNKWYGIDPTWIDEPKKVFKNISKNNLYYMIDLSKKSNTFSIEHYPNLTLYNKIPKNNRVSKMSIINKKLINKKKHKNY